MCIFAENKLVAPNTTEQAEQIFQQGRAYDVTVISDMPETLPNELRGMTPDRKKAKSFYQQAADLGHTGAMNNLAVYLHNGWGHGRGNYPEDFQAAYQMNVEMARRSDPRGYVGMANYLFSGDVGPIDESKAQACLIAGAKLEHIDAIRLIALDDIGRRTIGPASARPPERIERGIVLLEDVLLRGIEIAAVDLAEYHAYVIEDWRKFEFYARTAASMGAGEARVLLEGLYSNDRLPRDTSADAVCIAGMMRTDLKELETLCPHPNGCLTRTMVGLAQAPTELFDLSRLHPINLGSD